MSKSERSLIALRQNLLFTTEQMEFQPNLSVICLNQMILYILKKKKNVTSRLQLRRQKDCNKEKRFSGKEENNSSGIIFVLL